MRSLKNSEKGNVNIILMAVVAAVVLAVSVVIVFSIVGGLELTTVDANLRSSMGQSYPADGGDTANATQLAWNDTTPGANSTDNLLSNLETFYTISPIYIIVLAAVGIIAAIMMIVTRRP